MTPGWAAPENDVTLTRPFVGREWETALLRGLAAGGADAARIVVGEPGIGRTAVLRRLAETFPHRVVWVRGSRCEAELPYSAAAALLTELAAFFPKLPVAQRRALEVALALADGPVPRALAVCLGALGVLTAAARHEPVLVLVDDLQWVDRESSRLLVFLARRLADERVGLVMALREEPGLPTDLPDLPVLRLGGLDLADCHRLARAHGLLARDDEVAAVADVAGGNPLALVETLGGGPRTGDPAVDVGTSVLPAWRGVLARLPDLTREALVALALAGPVRPATLEAVLKELGLSLRDLEPAERQGLLTAELRLRHPLLAPVLLADASAAIRKEVNLALAAHAGPEHEAWYRSLAVTGPDEDLARRLAGLAERAEEPAVAARLSRRAAELTPDPAPRAGRLLAAAEAAVRAGRGEQAVAWSREAATLTTDPALVAAAASRTGQALQLGGQYRHAHDELSAAAAKLAPMAPVAAARLLCDAALPAMVMGDAGLACAAICEAELLAEDTPLPARARLLAAAAKAMHGLPEAEDVQPDGDPLVAALVHLWAERVAPARAAVNTAIDRLRHGGPPSLLAVALAVRGELGYRTGSWGAAHADALAAVDAAGTANGSVASGLFVLARLAAARGDEPREPLLARARAEAGRSDVDLRLLLDPAVRGLAALTAGEPGAAIEPLEAAWARTVATGVRHPNVVPFAGDLAEAHARCGDRDRAMEVVAWLEERAATLDVRTPLAAAWRCRGLLAADADAAAAAFAAAHLATGAAPFEHARTLLCEGEVLRRLRRPTSARAPLRRAAEVFAGLGATAWLSRAEAELSAAGDRDLPARPVDTALTPQQLRIASMVAAGHNNVETAEALFLSRKTVESHLTQVYRKLGVHSRTQLARVLASLGGAVGGAGQDPAAGRFET